MEIIMSERGKRFIKFLKMKLRERKGAVDGYDDADFAAEVGIEYKTMKRWLAAKDLKRIDIDNYWVVEEKYQGELKNFMRGENQED